MRPNSRILETKLKQNLELELGNNYKILRIDYYTSHNRIELVLTPKDRLSPRVIYIYPITTDNPQTWSANMTVFNQGSQHNNIELLKLAIKTLTTTIKTIKENTKQ